MEVCSLSLSFWKTGLHPPPVPSFSLHGCRSNCNSSSSSLLQVATTWKTPVPSYFGYIQACARNRCQSKPKSSKLCTGRPTPFALVFAATWRHSLRVRTYEGIALAYTFWTWCHVSLSSGSSCVLAGTSGVSKVCDWVLNSAHCE